MFALLRRSMISRMLAVGVVALATSGSQFSCSNGEGSVRIGDPPPPPQEVGNPNFTTLLALKDSAGIEKYQFQPGELIYFEVTVRNRSSQDAFVSYTGYTGTVDVFTNGGNAPIWNPFDGMAFAQVVQYTTVAAGDSQVFRFTWNQLLPSGASLGFGIYEARGLFEARVRLGGPNGPLVDERDLRSTLRQFTIH